MAIPRRIRRYAGRHALADHIEGWFVSFPEPPAEAPEGLGAVVDLGLGQTWPPPPDRSLVAPAGGRPARRPSAAPTEI